MDKIKNLMSAPSVQIGFGMALFAVLIGLIWKIRNAVKRSKSVTAYGIKGDGEISAERAHLLAEKLFNAMARFGTDEDEIFAIYDELTKYKKAVLQVHEAFGLKGYAIDSYASIGVKCNLRQWLKKELSAKEYALWDVLYNEAVSE